MWQPRTKRRNLLHLGRSSGGDGQPLILRNAPGGSGFRTTFAPMACDLVGGNLVTFALEQTLRLGAALASKFQLST